MMTMQHVVSASVVSLGKHMALVIYLHQLGEEVHGYCCAFVEEHGHASQETLEGGIQKEKSSNRVNQSWTTLWESETV